jgi:hypothetical protein
MFQYNLEAFDAGQPLRPGASTVTIAQALLCEDLLVTWQGKPTPEESGAALLAAHDLRDVKNVHLGAERVRFLDVPADEDAMRERIAWMWHAGSCSRGPQRACRAAEATEVMIDQVALNAEFEPATLAEGLAALNEIEPELVAALFCGDLDDVPGLIDDAVDRGAARTELVGPAAWMFVCWAALEQQREACLGWRLIRKPLDEVWGNEMTKSWTIGQIFRPKTGEHAFAHEMQKLYYDNLRSDVDRVEDKRTVNRIERTLRKLSLGGVNRANESEIIALFGKDRIGRIPALLRRHGGDADAYHRRYLAILTGADGTSRAGRRADMLAARISAVHRSAIVFARTCHLAALAAKAGTTGDLCAMLDTRLPEVLRPCSGTRQKDWGKFRLRQLFHVVRMEFLQDGEHLPKAMKSMAPAEHPELPLELDAGEDRRGHELFDQCWAELNDQPADWRFITPFGWQCDGLPRVRLSAPA